MNISIIPTLVIFLLMFLCIGLYKSKKKKFNKDKQSLSDGGTKYPGQKKDEIWRTIKEFLWNNGERGLQAVYTYSIKRPHPHEIHNRLKAGKIYEFKKKAKLKGIKYKRPEIPVQFPLEQYFADLALETYQLSLVEKQHASGVPEVLKGHRQRSHKFKLSNIKLTIYKKQVLCLFKKTRAPALYPKYLLERDLYVLIFQTKDAKKDVMHPPRAIEVEIIKKAISGTSHERKIIVNKELNVNKELSWIMPQKDKDDEDQQKTLKDKVVAIEKKKKSDARKSKAKAIFVTPLVNLFYVVKTKLTKKQDD